MVKRARRPALRFRVVVPLALAFSLALAGSASAAVPGWAPGGDPKKPETQHRADLATQGNASLCAANTIVLFRVRGSGESYGSDKLGQWTGTMGATLIRKGWQVRDLQARYDAPKVPGAKIFAGAVRRSPAAIVKAIKEYRDSASKEWQWVRTELVGAADRCPSRKIAIAGYSQGNIILRYVLPNLPARVLKQIVTVDLVSDPTADIKVDAVLATDPRDSDARRTEEGIDTWGARKLRPWFTQTRFPTVLHKKTIQYCAGSDLICNAGPNVGSIPAWANVWKQHNSYTFSGIGYATSRRRIPIAPIPAITPARTAPAPSAPAAPAPSAAAPSAPSTPSAPTTPSTPSTPSTPTVSNRLSNDGRLIASQNQFLRSANGRYRLVMQQDGNLVLYGPSGRPLWSSNTVGRGANHLRMQGDGNLVIYNGSNRAVWTSNTPRHYSAYLIVQNDGNVVIYNGSTPIWSTNTAGRS
jgi:hypothetical protein